MKKPRILKLEYFSSFYCIDLEEIQYISLQEDVLTIDFLNTNQLLIYADEEDDDNELITRILLDTFTSWKNYDSQREENGMRMLISE